MADEPWRVALKKMNLKLSERLQVTPVIRFLWSKERLTDEEKQEIEAKTTEKTKTDKLVDVLMRKTKAHFDVFLEALRDRNVDLADLADELEQRSGSTVQPSRSHPRNIPDERDVQRRLLPSICPDDPDAALNLDNELVGAAMRSDTADVRENLQKGANVAGKDDVWGRTALHWAALYGNNETVRILLQKKAEINCKDKNGRTALHLAAMNANDETVRILQQNGAEINSKDKDGRTALAYAKQFAKVTTIRLLQNFGARQ